MSALKIFIGIITALPFILLGIFYNFLPPAVPVFTDIFGNPSVIGPKSIITVFRVPVMALLLQVVCLIMYGNIFSDVKKDRENLVYVNRNLWSAFSIFIALKMSLISLEIIFITSSSYLKFAGMIRTLELLVVIVALIFLFYWIGQLRSSIKETGIVRGNFFVKDKSRSGEFLLNIFSMNMANPKFYVLIGSLVMYIIVVVLPLIVL